jgi:hypothetical protein
MIIERGKNYSIEYKKANGEVTQREIIPLTESPKNIKAFDVTELNDLQKKFLTDKQAAYNEYTAQFIANMFDFDTWYEHTYGEKFPEGVIKHRTFTVENITVK